MSGEDLKSNIDHLNEANKSRVPVPDSTKNVMYMEVATASEHVRLSQMTTIKTQ